MSHFLLNYLASLQNHPQTATEKPTWNAQIILFLFPLVAITDDGNTQ